MGASPVSKQFSRNMTSAALQNVPKVDIDPSGVFKYILIKVHEDTKTDNESFITVLRGYKRCDYHSDIFDEVQEKLKPLDCEPLGGGRISHDPDNKKLHIYGYSQGYGKADHEEAAKLIKEVYPEYTVTISCGWLLPNMPKKFAGENSKAVAARQRKENAKLEKDEKVKKSVEDAMWEDNDEKLKKKQQKKDDQEKKRLEQLQKKAEAKALLEKEMESIKAVAKAPPPAKITRAQINTIKEKTIKSEPVKAVCSRVIVDEEPLVENLNRVQLDGDVAQTVDEAISILSNDTLEADKHPEKRLKAAYNAFEEINLPRLKAENPTLRLSQLKQMLRKEWLKSPQNPMNQKA